MAKVSMSVWGHGLAWNMDFLKSKKELESLQKKIDSGDWEYDDYGEQDEHWEGGVNIRPEQATFAIDDAKGKTVFESDVDALPYSVFSHSYTIMEQGCCSNKDKIFGVWIYEETAKGWFFGLKTSLPKTGFDVNKLNITVEHFIRNGKEIFSYISEVSYDNEDFDSEPEVDFKGGGSLSVY